MYTTYHFLGWHPLRSMCASVYIYTSSYMYLSYTCGILSLYEPPSKCMVWAKFQTISLTIIVVWWACRFTVFSATGNMHVSHPHATTTWHILPFNWLLNQATVHMPSPTSYLNPIATVSLWQIWGADYRIYSRLHVVMVVTCSYCNGLSVGIKWE